MSKDKIRDVLTQYGEDYNDQNVWKVQGTPVISHKTLERIAAKAGVVYAMPTIIRAERDEAVIMVSGSLDGRTEWSIGEALVNVNYRVSGKQAGYVWAMAEKRAKDRVILKLVSLHGLAYSEEEADEFKGRGAERPTAFDHPAEPEGPSDRDIAERFVGECEHKIENFKDPMSLKTWWASAELRQQVSDFGLTEADWSALKAKMIARGTALSLNVAA